MIWKPPGYGNPDYKADLKKREDTFAACKRLFNYAETGNGDWVNVHGDIYIVLHALGYRHEHDA